MTKGKVDVVVGLQCGDCGKGRFVDYLAPEYDIIARFNGGPNAGHSIWLNGKKFVTHIIPSGILYPDKICVIGPGCVISLDGLKKEIFELREAGIKVTPDNLKISHAAHVILNEHIELDKQKNEYLGTTKQGIGPAYSDKAARSGTRMGYVDDHEIKTFICDTTAFVNTKLEQCARILCEGAQAFLLDIDHGQYPYVTSCNTTSGAVCTGLGISPRWVDKVFGVFKAYVTKVGTGPFPTLIEDPDLEEKIREYGKEFGATTGRPRKCGWLDLVLLRTAIKVNGITDLAMTKLDVFDCLDEFKVCTEYEKISISDYSAEFNGKSFIKEWPQIDNLNLYKPVYKTFEGWRWNDEVNGQYSGVFNKPASLIPKRAWDYVNFIENNASDNVLISLLSTGPERTSIINMRQT